MHVNAKTNKPESAVILQSGTGQTGQIRSIIVTWTDHQRSLEATDASVDFYEGGNLKFSPTFSKNVSKIN